MTKTKKYTITLKVLGLFFFSFICLNTFSQDSIQNNYSQNASSQVDTSTLNSTNSSNSIEINKDETINSEPQKNETNKQTTENKQTSNLRKDVHSVSFLQKFMFGFFIATFFVFLAITGYKVRKKDQRYSKGYREVQNNFNTRNVFWISVIAGVIYGFYYAFNN